MHYAEYPREHAHVLLNQFAKAIKSKQYTERIPYNAWKNIAESEEVVVEVKNSIVKVYGCKRVDIDEDLTLLYSDKIYDWGFGRFYWDNYINTEQENDTMTTNMPAAIPSAI